MEAVPNKSVWTSRKTWAAIITLLVIIISSFIPGFTLDQDRAVEFAGVAAVYIVGVAMDPGNRPGWEGVFKSRKFWGSIAGLAIVFLRGFNVELPVSEDVLTGMLAAVSAFVLGVSAETIQKLLPYSYTAEKDIPR